VLKIHNLTPDSFHKKYLVTQKKATTLSDYCWSLGLPFSFDEDSYLCEIELPKGADIKLNLQEIDWSFLSKNKSKKLILTHRIIYSLSEFREELNEIIIKNDLHGRVFWLSMNPVDFKFKKHCLFNLLFLDSLIHATLEFNILRLYEKFKKNSTFNISKDYFIKHNDSSIYKHSLLYEVKNQQRISFDDCDKYFLSASRVQKAHRLIATYLIKNNTAVDSVITQHGFNDDYLDLENYLDAHRDDLEKFGISLSELLKFRTFRGSSFGSEVSDKFIGTISDHQQVISECLVNYVNETTSNDVEIFLTEKTWGNYLYGRPFILNGNKGSIAYLNKYYGFKSFEGLFDEKYDLMDSYVDRVYYGVEELVKFCCLDFKQAKEKVESLEAVYTHNYKVFNSIDFKKMFLKVFDGI